MLRTPRRHLPPSRSRCHLRPAEQRISRPAHGAQRQLCAAGHSAASSSLGNGIRVDSKTSPLRWPRSTPTWISRSALNRPAGIAAGRHRRTSTSPAQFLSTQNACSSALPTMQRPTPTGTVSASACEDCATPSVVWYPGLQRSRYSRRRSARLRRDRRAQATHSWRALRCIWPSSSAGSASPP